MTMSVHVLGLYVQKAGHVLLSSMNRPIEFGDFSGVDDCGHWHRTDASEGSQ
jgi:hypothetical protein